MSQLGILGDDLLYTMNGREYLTTARLRQEVQACLTRAGGRLSMVELPALLGVDLVRTPSFLLFQEEDDMPACLAGPLCPPPPPPSPDRPFPPFSCMRQVHCERQARVLVESSSGAVMESNGELLTQKYFDGLAAEVNELLQVR
jgi:hypothetical protein